MQFHPVKVQEILNKENTLVEKADSMKVR